MPALRRDAARNRERILTAARALQEAGETPQLNAVARRAEVGVGTVYRHFPTPEALAEGLVADRFAALAEAAADAALDPDALQALRTFLAEALRAYADDPAFAAATVATAPVLDETRVLRADLHRAFADLVDRAAPLLRPGLDATDVLILVCGLAYSVRLRPAKAVDYLDALLSGVLR